jgi:hypothetical protein
MRLFQFKVKISILRVIYSLLNCVEKSHELISYVTIFLTFLTIPPQLCGESTSNGILSKMYLCEKYIYYR